MKKSLIVITLLSTMMMLSGCYNYGIGSQYGKLVDIKFYNLEYEEIVGEWYEYGYFSSDPELSNQTIKLSRSIRPINSPAPNNMYYVTEVEEGITVIARIVIKSGNGYQFSSIVMNNMLKYTQDDLYHIEQNDEFIYLDFLCENITTESRIYHIRGFDMEKEFTSGTKIVRGSLWIEGRSYYSGFIFQIKEQQTI
jgi:hypothetical protein